MRGSVRLVLVCPLALALFAACETEPRSDVGVDAGSPDGAEVDVAAADPVHAACSALAATRCARLGSCTAPSFANPSYPCEAAVTALCERYVTPSSNVRAADIEACTAKTAAEPCSVVMERPTLCDFAAGNGAIGQRCLLSTDCAAGSCLDSSTCKVCTELPPPAAYAVEGEACGDQLPCLGSSCVASVCRPLLETAGAACDPQTAPCNRWRGLRCDETTRVCTVFTPSARGASCETACVLGSHCNVIKCYDAQHCARACMGELELGERCVFPDSSCNPGLDCVDGLCAIDRGTSCVE